MVFQVVVPSVESDKLAYREESVPTAWMWTGVQSIKPPLSTIFVKFVPTRFPVLQTITRTELYVVSCFDSFLLMRVGTIQVILIVVTFLCICVCM